MNPNPDLEAAFLDAIADNPEDDTPRLVFADYLMEQGNPRGDLIRVQVELARLDEDAPQRRELERLEADLLNAHERRWLNHPLDGLVVMFERGLLTIETSRWGKLESQWLEQQSGWIARLTLLDLSDKRLGFLTTSAAARRVPGVEIEGGSITDSGLAFLTRMSRLRRLSLANLSVTHRGLAHLDQLPSLTELALIRLPTDAASLECVSDLQGLRVLEVQGASWNVGASCFRLARLKELRRLRLANVAVSDDELPPLADLPHLTSLDLSGTNITDMAIARLEPLTRLQELNLSRTALTDAVMPVLARQTGLRVLNLGIPGLTDVGLKSLSGLSELRELDLTAAPITDTGVSSLRGLTALRKLELSRTRISDDAIGSLLDLSRLHTLGLTGTALTDEGLTRLAALPGLRVLNVRGTAVTEERVRELGRALPRCQIEWGKDLQVYQPRSILPGLPG
jgi:uncharacterized protein (TIGR02996 family)